MLKKELCFPTTDVKSGHRNPPNIHQLSSFPYPDARLHQDQLTRDPRATVVTQGVTQGKMKMETAERSRALGLTVHCLPQTASRVEGPPEQDPLRLVWLRESSAWEKQHKNYSVFSYRLSPAFPCIPGEVFLWVHTSRGTSWKPGEAHGKWDWPERSGALGSAGPCPRVGAAPAPWEGITVGNAILTSAMSTLAFLRLALRMLGRGTDTRKASAKVSESVSSLGGGHQIEAAREGGEPQIRLSLREGTQTLAIPLMAGTYAAARTCLSHPASGETCRGRRRVSVPAEKSNSYWEENSNVRVIS